MLAEEIRSEFLFKVTGTALNWKPIPKQKVLTGIACFLELFDVLLLADILISLFSAS